MKCQKGAVASQARSIGAQCHQLTSPLVAMQLINQVARELLASEGLVPASDKKGKGGKHR